MFDIKNEFNSLLPKIISTRVSQPLSYQVPLQHSDRWACTPSAFQQISMYSFSISTDEHALLQNLMTKYFVIIIHRYI